MHTYPCGRLTATRSLGLSMISQRIEAGARAPVPAGDFKDKKRTCRAVQAGHDTSCH